MLKGIRLEKYLAEFSRGNPGVVTAVTDKKCKVV